MKTTGERIRYLRKEVLKKTQKNFGSAIGLKPNSISDIESGKNIPTEQTLKAICREFNINEDWLRNGTGDMKNKLTKNQEIGEFANEVMNLPDEDFKKRFIEALTKLDSRDWETIQKIVDGITTKED